MKRLSLVRIADFLLIGGLLLVVFGGFFLYAYPEVSHDETSLSGASEISGIIGIKKGGGQSTGIALYGPNGSMLFSCYQGDCGYPEWRDDVGRSATFAVLNGRVIQISVNGRQRLAVHDFIERTDRHRSRAGICILSGVALLVAAFIANRRSRASALGTAD